jgi:hypothetical protein
MKISCDIQSETFLEKNLAYNSKTKNIDVQYHFIKDMMERIKVLLDKVDKLENILDSLTKCLSSVKFSRCREKMGISSLGLQTNFKDLLVSAKKTTSGIILGCYIICSQIPVEVDRLTVEVDVDR